MGGKDLELNDELQVEFIVDAGIVKDCELSLPYGVQLSNDKWNLFLPWLGFEETLIGFLKEGEDVSEGIEVKVYDKGGHEFQMMLKKWVKDSNQFYVLNRGWFSFCNQHCLEQDDLIALRVFRHAITDILSFVVTFRRMSVAFNWWSIRVRSCGVISKVGFWVIPGT
ncbi:putative B3 domain-containing protein At4g03170 [Phaseolus vulgaris]|uniref:putative B3 domain-containing protein At4g03170 n=1 Tax=Phaseolus vulgaris TaxID=3885 RepID=UPI0035C9B8C7